MCKQCTTVGSWDCIVLLIIVFNQQHVGNTKYRLPRQTQWYDYLEPPVTVNAVIHNYHFGNAI